MLIKTGLLIDGTGSPPQSGYYIAIEKGKITTIGREVDFSANEIKSAIDYSSYTILPGLIDSHVPSFSRRYL